MKTIFYLVKLLFFIFLIYQGVIQQMNYLMIGGAIFLGLLLRDLPKFRKYNFKKIEIN